MKKKSKDVTDFLTEYSRKFHVFYIENYGGET